jgi:RHH-type proline utilization regulon transcriptional repressor/proline dehydrogenase/delta 1-pyrroline-5-carboxylate dehydrogenase
MKFVGEFPEPGKLRAAIEQAYRADENETVQTLLDASEMDSKGRRRVEATARRLVEEMRLRSHGAGGLDAFMQEYELSNQEGVTLMCLAEALLRIPDAETANKLIRDKITEADWEGHLGHSESVFVNASTWALMLTGRVVEMDVDGDASPVTYLKRLVAKSGEPVIRQAMIQAMKIMGRQFVMGRTIEEALARASEGEAAGYRHSFDMLGESALTAADAERYMQAYSAAIAAVGRESAGRGPIDGPGVSVKLSALHPRYELAQRRRVMSELGPRLLQLAEQARDVGIGLCVDAEEADRLDISLDVIESVSGASSLKGWDGFGLALQAYQKRAYPVIDWLTDLAQRHSRRLMVRLVKGAYWDTEIKRAQEDGLGSYPVFTRKASTDVSFLACAAKLLADPKAFYGQFATHNAHTLAAVKEMAGTNQEFEFQRLHGMGEPLYDEIVGASDGAIPCRIYGPVGSHEDLLAYLVRRLLENGANTSFVNRIADATAPIEEIIADPWLSVSALTDKPHPAIPLPADLYGEVRRNSAGLDLTNTARLRDLAEEIEAHGGPWRAAPAGGGEGPVETMFEPADRNREVGTVTNAAAADLERALSAAQESAPGWNGTPAEDRAQALERAADLMEENTAELMALCVREAGKTIADTVPEVREAVDFLRYYAHRARIDFAGPERLPGPTGECNEISLHGRGVFACISPWNFPLAIFTGQVCAGLAAGNAVVAKPAEQTPLIAAYAVDLLHQAGVPRDVLHLLPGDGPTVGAPLIADARISGVAFTGSSETAKAINMKLANRSGPIVPLIAETGGQNAMIADSTALPEQVVGDAVFSAFRSAGQRCSALRVLFIQSDIADRVISMLAGATEELVVGDPGLLATDVGPVIDEAARDMLETHAQRMDRDGRMLCRVAMPDAKNGTFFVPTAYEIDNLDVLDGEVFGPILHVIRYPADRLDQVIGAINATGFGLTLGIHSRVDSTQKYVQEHLRVGNTYVNRNMIGAVVGVQPFGGEGLSGTGPKAGGPRYLHRFAVERTLSVNTTAAGGNAALVSLEE